MAGDWIKMRVNLWDDPRVSGLCDLTGAKEAAIIGGLYWLWATADQHTSDGMMAGLSVATIDRKTGIKGFGSALVEVGWIAEEETGIRIERFSEHNGSSAKDRAQTAKRVANCKAKGNAKVTDEALPKQEKSNVATVTSALPREDKREESTPLSPSLRSGDTPPADQDKIDKAMTFRKWLEQIKAKGESPISGYRAVFDYCETVGIAGDWLQLAWFKFRERYLEDEKAKRKRYSNWRRVFLRTVKEGWFGLWVIRADKAFLTTAGEQAQREYSERLAA